MPRISKKTELVPMDAPSLMPEDYSDYGSALIQYGLLVWQKDGQKLLADGSDGESAVSVPVPLSLVQVQYLNMRMAGITAKDACKALSIGAMTPMLWEEESGKDSLYAKCMDAFKTMQARQAEDMIWDATINDGSPKRDILRMFAMKARMPEYRENASNVTAPVLVNITVDGNPFVVDTSIKEAGSDDNE